MLEEPVELLSGNEYQIIRICTRIFSALGMLGAVFIFLTFLFIKNLRKKVTFRYVVYLSLADFIFSLSGILILTTDSDGPYCMFVGAIDVFGFLSSFMWISVFSVNVYHIAKRREKKLETLERLYLFLCYFIPVLITAIPFLPNFDFYGLNIGVGCIFKATGAGGDLDTHVIVTIILIYIPIFVTLCVNIVAYTFALKSLKDILQPEDIRRLLFDILWYPLAYIICWIFPLIYFVILDSMSRENFWIMVLGMSLSRMQGFVNAFLYGFHKSVRMEIKKVWESKSKTGTPNMGTMTPLQGGSGIYI